MVACALRVSTPLSIVDRPTGANGAKIPADATDHLRRAYSTVEEGYIVCRVVASRPLRLRAYVYDRTVMVLSRGIFN